MKGRKPKPAALRAIDGGRSRRGKKKAARATKAAGGCSPPVWLTGYARREFKIKAKLLEAVGLLAEIDRDLLAGYCQQLALYREATEELEATGGRVLKTEKGSLYFNPWHGIQGKALERLLKIAAEFGMSPSARMRVRPGEPAAADPIGDLLGGD